MQDSCVVLAPKVPLVPLAAAGGVSQFGEKEQEEERERQGNIFVFYANEGSLICTCQYEGERVQDAPNGTLKTFGHVLECTLRISFSLSLFLSMLKQIYCLNEQDVNVP